MNFVLCDPQRADYGLQPSTFSGVVMELRTLHRGSNLLHFGTQACTSGRAYRRRNISSMLPALYAAVGPSPDIREIPASRGIILLSIHITVGPTVEPKH